MMFCLNTWYIPLLVLASVFGNQASYTGCRRGWLQHDDQCYKISRHATTFVDARLMCQEEYASLASLTNIEVKKFINITFQMECTDRSANCSHRAEVGECITNQTMGQKVCRYSCDMCYNNRETPWNYWIAGSSKTGNCLFIHSKNKLLQNRKCINESVDNPPRAFFICEQPVRQRPSPWIQKFHPGCSTGSIGFRQKCYRMITVPMSWDKAGDYCEYNKGRLLTIPGWAEWNFITKASRNRTASFEDVAHSWVEHHGQVPIDTQIRGLKYVGYLLYGKPGHPDQCLKVEVKAEEEALNPANCTERARFWCEFPTNMSLEVQNPESKLEECRIGWVLFRNHCYKGFEERRSCSDAFSTCSRYDGELLTVYDLDLDDYNEIRGLLLGYNDPSLNLRRLRWVWVSPPSQNLSESDLIRWDIIITNLTVKDQFELNLRHVICNGTDDLTNEDYKSYLRINFICQKFREPVNKLTSTTDIFTTYSTKPSNEQVNKGDIAGLDSSEATDLSLDMTSTYRTPSRTGTDYLEFSENGQKNDDTEPVTKQTTQTIKSTNLFTTHSTKPLNKNVNKVDTARVDSSQATDVPPDMISTPWTSSRTGTDYVNLSEKEEKINDAATSSDRTSTTVSIPLGLVFSILLILGILAVWRFGLPYLRHARSTTGHFISEYDELDPGQYWVFYSKSGYQMYSEGGKRQSVDEEEF